MTPEQLIKEALELFPAERPEHFTDPNHCEECRDHDETLLANTREEISYEVLGNPAWDPICFVGEDGFKYYFPAMARLALEGKNEKYYIDQFLFHITQNTSCMSFDEKQSKYVVKILEYLLENMTEEIESNMDADDIFHALEKWRRK